MTLRNIPAVQIGGPQQSAPLSKSQKQFNTLSRKVEKLKAELTAWQQDVVPYHQKVSHEYTTLRKTYNDYRAKLVQLFDSACNHNSVNKQERKKLKQLIADITSELMEEAPTDALKALHDKYSDVRFDTKTELTGDLMKSVFEDMFGIEIDDDVNVDSPGELGAHIEEKLREYSEHSQKQGELHGHNGKRRKQTARQAAKEQQRQAEQQDIRKSLQDVYRKLASALHPDREPDAGERERKTRLMQRANIAYNKRDLLQLLALQLETEQIDLAHINTISDNRLQHYIKILKEQCRELQEAITETLFAFGPEFAFSDYGKMSPKKVMTGMQRDLSEMRGSVKAIQHDLSSFQDFKHLKAWLRHYQLHQEHEFEDFMDFALDGPFPLFDDDEFFTPSEPKRKAGKKPRKRRNQRA
ncbi:MAG: J domain-containing protein [Gammaproteobacteria bacterium]|nr:J domain-containing protein [Gammaproteobacteria bacterium]